MTITLRSASTTTATTKSAALTYEELDANFTTLAAQDVADRASLAADTGASLVGFLQSGSGAIATTVQARLQQYPSILDFIPVALHAGIKARTDTTDLSSYITAAYAAASVYHWPSGRYYTASSIDLTAIYGAGIVGDSWSDGVADDWGQTEIVVNATNTPGLKVWGPVRLENFIIGYAAQQTTAHTASRTVEFNNIAHGFVNNVKAKYGNTNFGIPQSAFGATSYNIIFSSLIGSLYSYSASEAHYDFRNYSGGGTNVKMGPLYVNGGGSLDFVTAGQSANYAIRGTNWSGYEFAAVSVDALEIVEQVMSTTNCQFTVGTIRTEAMTFKNDNDGWYLFGGSDSSVSVGSVVVTNCRALLADVPNATYLFRSNATKSFINIDSLFVNDDCSFTSAVNRVLLISSTDAGSAFHLHHFNNEDGNLSSTSWTDSSSLAHSPIKTWNGAINAASVKQGNSTTVNTVDYGTAAPTTGTWTAGSVRFNTAPAVGEPFAWLCVVAGTPGTWVNVGGVPLVATTAVGNVGTGEDNLQTVTLPASMMLVTGSTVRITAWGTKANNGDAKTLKLYFGSAAILTHALGTGAAGSWKITADVISTGTDAQDYNAFLIGTDTDAEIGTTTQDDGAAIVIKCTGEATSNNDIVQEGLIVELLR